jgi:hypothetical protein
MERRWVPRTIASDPVVVIFGPGRTGWSSCVVRDNASPWPTSLYQDYYIEDLWEGKEAVVQDFQRLRRVLEAEADEGGYIQVRQQAWSSSATYD